MATQSIPVPQTVAKTIPWYLWTLTAAVFLVTLGGQTDVSWHRSIGRDGFWIPPHMMVYACGLLAAVSCGYLLLASTFGAHPDLRATSIHILGLRAPTGVFLTAWGGLTMLASAPFDNWWHNAYGLDVQVQSPPHIVLLVGTWAVCLGTLLLAAAQMNRARINQASQTLESSLPFERIFLLVGALAVIHLMSYSMSYTFDTRLHQARPYLVMSTGVPFALAALSTAAHRRSAAREWTATLLTGLYTASMLALVWLLPLIPAHPALGPVYQNVTHLIPPKFPILLLVPAFALDLIRQRLPHLKPLAAAITSGIAWLTLLAAAEWPFATFLMSPHAANRFFGTLYLDFGTPPNNPDALRIFENPQHGLHLLAGLATATAAAILATCAGNAFGRWMHQIQR